MAVITFSVRLPHSRRDLVPYYVAAVAGLGAAAAVGSAVITPHPRWILVAIFAAAGAVAERIRVQVRTDSTTMSPLLAVFLAAAVVAGPVAASACAVAGALSAGLLTRSRPPLRKTIFNAGLYSLGAAAAGTVYLEMGGRLGLRDAGPADVLACALALVANFAINWPLLIGVLHLATGRSAREIWDESLRWMPLQVTLLAAVGFTLGAACNLFGFAGALVYVAPLLAVRQASQHFTSRMRHQLDEVTEAHRSADRANQALRESNQAFLSANARLDDTNQALLKTLASIIDARDVFLFGHSMQASEYAGKVARRLGLNDDEVHTVELGALLHDLGKIGVPDDILNKPAPLTESEYDRVKQHCETGYALLADLPSFGGVAEIVRSHHEHFDGTGYPRGLSGSAIPLGARIVSVVESVDAMTSDRPYRRGLTSHELIDELRRGAGSQWDPAVIDALVQVLSSSGGGMRNSALEVALRRSQVHLSGGRADAWSDYESADQSILILDDTMTVVSANRAAAAMLGRNQGALTGMQLRDLVADEPNLAASPRVFFEARHRLRLRHRRGTIVDCEVDGTPLRTASASYWLLTARDVTDSGGDQAAARSSRRHLRIEAG
ncbi:MAG: HD-GYP domain-containing protein [Candidatus Dormibacteria bacterium]